MSLLFCERLWMEFHSLYERSVNVYACMSHVGTLARKHAHIHTKYIGRASLVNYNTRFHDSIKVGNTCVFEREIVRKKNSCKRLLCITEITPQFSTPHTFFLIRPSAEKKFMTIISPVYYSEVVFPWQCREMIIEFLCPDAGSQKEICPIPMKQIIPLTNNLETVRL